MKLKKGKYLVVDPYYVWPGDWEEFLKDFIEGRDPYRVMHDKCIDYHVLKTAGKYGGYPINEGEKQIGTLPSHSGLLAVIPIELIEKWECSKSETSWGTFVELIVDARRLKLDDKGFHFGIFSVFSA